MRPKVLHLARDLCKIILVMSAGVTQSLVGDNGYPGLDRFGRLLDLYFKDGSDATVHRYQYGYDLAGNRTHCRATQVADASTSHDNDRSWLYSYDSLNRLIDAGMGQLNDANTNIQHVGPTPQDIHWYLDNLGNWSGTGHDASSNLVGGRVWTDGTDQVVQHHSVNPANQITAASSQPVLAAATQPAFPTPNAEPYIYDPAGNLVWDGRYYYQYDAFNHLIAVRQRHGSSINSTTGQVASGILGDLVSRYIYDGLGRLIAKVSPEYVKEGVTYYQTKRYYYDGVRRIAEVVSRHDESLPVHGKNDELILDDADTDGLPDSLESVETWTDREYVYGPSDVDEYVAQIDRDGDSLYMLQDANLNVVALVAGGSLSPGSGGGGGGGDSPSVGTVVEQYTYDPYGTLLADDILDLDSEGHPQHALNRIGFQGLPFDRLNGTVDDAPLAVSTPTASPSDQPQGFYYARNRNYSPSLGRWIQRDPNETAMPIITALAMNAVPMGDMAGNTSFDMQGQYGDGMNLYQFGSGNPLTRRDSLGTDDYDDAIGGALSDRFGAMMVLGKARRQLSDGVRMANLYMLASFGFDSFMWDINENILLDLVTGPFASTCCFVSGTRVAMADGWTKTIEEIQSGDRVLCEPTPEDPTASASGLVVSRMDRVAPTILELQVLADGTMSAIVTTAEHPFFVPRLNRFVPAMDLEPGECLAVTDGSIVEVVGKHEYADPTPVHNLEVAGVHNYYVALGEHGPFVLVHNACSFKIKGFFRAAGEFGIKSYGELKYAVTAAGRAGLEVHHLIEARFAKVLGVSERGMASIVMTPKEHQVFTNLWREAVPYGTKYAEMTAAQVYAHAREIYKPFPEILAALGL